MKRSYIIFPVFIILILALSACSTPPIEDMNNANDAVIRAENDADAIAYAPGTLVRARDALARMQGEVDAKRYEDAKSFAAEAISIAERAISEGKTGAARVRDEASNLISSLSELLAETTVAIAKAREAQNIDADFESLSRDLALASRTFEDSKLSFQAGKYRNAIAESQSARSLLADINSKLSNAVQIVSRKK